jgi:hypothetical protein
MTFYYIPPSPRPAERVHPTLMGALPLFRERSAPKAGIHPAEERTWIGGSEWEGPAGLTNARRGARRQGRQQ